MADPLLIESKHRSEGVTFHLHTRFIAVESIVEETLAMKPRGLFPMKAGGRGCVSRAGKWLYLRKENHSLAKTLVSSKSEVSVSTVPSKLLACDKLSPSRRNYM